MNSIGFLAVDNMGSQNGRAGGECPRLHPELVTRVKPLVVLVGPTAIGKSRIAIPVAKAMGTEILTADSTQVYRGMDIGTDKPSLADREAVPHWLIDLVNPDEPFNAGTYRRYALQVIERLHRTGKVPLIVGGTGLYIRAVIRGLWPGPPVDWSLRRALEAEAEERGLAAMYHELLRVDPQAVQRVHPHDRVKILRALEVYRQTGTPLSVAHQRHGFQDRPFTPLLLGLMMERSALYRRIEARVDVELAKGLVEETRRLLQSGYDRNLVSMKSLGYRQMAGFVLGEYSFEEAVRRLKRDTRRFAKRQMTWFRKEPDLVWIELQEHDAEEEVVERIMAHVNRFFHWLSGSEIRPLPQDDKSRSHEENAGRTEELGQGQRTSCHPVTSMAQEGGNA
ncbi:MAG: tRNA (adenosine(37)-N6)-dimethylallyltransferase MiaA [Nitrospirae bacterium]|nr:MAG: tRNA (adenosine(37)-N6)-dimethylallyltransferase MiaA [Nitrospirota bacterium]